MNKFLHKKHLTNIRVLEKNNKGFAQLGIVLIYFERKKLIILMAII